MFVDCDTPNHTTAHLQYTTDPFKTGTTNDLSSMVLDLVESNRKSGDEKLKKKRGGLCTGRALNINRESEQFEKTLYRQYFSATHPEKRMHCFGMFLTRDLIKDLEYVAHLLTSSVCTRCRSDRSTCPVAAPCRESGLSTLASMRGRCTLFFYVIVLVSSRCHCTLREVGGGWSVGR